MTNDVANEVARSVGRLAVWVGENIERWAGFWEDLCDVMAISKE